MTIQQDDPRLTAYALGELSDEERAQFELLLARDARARAEVAAIGQTSARLSRELRGENTFALSERRRASIRAALTTNGAATPSDSAALDTALEQLPAANQEETQDGANRDLAAVFRPRWPRRRVLWAWLAALVPCAGMVALMLSNSSDESYEGALEQGTSAALKLGSAEGPRESALRSASSEGIVGLLAPDPGEEVASRGLAPAVQALADPVREPARLEMRVQDQGVALPHVAGLSDPLASPGAYGSRAVARRSAANDGQMRAQMLAPPPQRVDELGALTDFNRESYDALEENPFLRVSTDPRSTFSIDVDTASYALVRRFLQNGQLPPSGAVRIEELINYFTYRYPQPTGDAPVNVVANVAQAPWAPEHRLVRVALQGRHVAASARPPANLVFLIDVSGSMMPPNKLALVKYGLRQLSESLQAKDRVSIVTYAGNSGLVLAPTPGSRRDQILQAIDQLEAGGSTNGGSGIQLAYAQARKHFVKGNVNRVILATDGDFNVGVTSQSELVELVQREAKSGVFLSVLGFGDGNYQDSMLEKLADKGNGNYAYIDEPAEAQKVLVEQATGTLLTLAKDVKLQLEFNPAEVAAYRLIGYENRKLGHQDFNDDTKDAGELGADHSVTALYEVIPTGKPVPGASVDPLKYQAPAAAPATPLQTSTFQGELLSIKLRYQPPAGGASQLIEQTVRGPAQALDEDFRFAAAVAEFGMLLRDSPHRGKAAYDQVLKLAQSSLGDGKDRPAREQFVELVRAARRLGKPSGGAPQHPTDDYDFGL